MTSPELRDALNRLGLSQAGFARMVNLSPLAIHRWLAGNRKIPGWVPSWLAMFEIVREEE